MTDTVPWPFPGDTEVDKARRVARDYRGALADIAPDLCARIDAAARRLGQTWIAPQLAILELDDYVPAYQLAEHVGVKVDVIYQWAHRGHITRYGRKGKPLYKVREAVDYHAKLRERRIERHEKRQSGRSVV